jgi:hypothetical protein
MENIAVSVSTDEDNNMILNFNSDEEIKVLTSGDVDLTEFVTKLTCLIDKKPQISFTKYAFENPKFNLIQETIEKITVSFNESTNSEDNTIDEDVK